VLEAARDELADELLGFFRARLKHQLAADHPADVVEAVLVVGLDDVLSVADRVEALAHLQEQEDFRPLAEGFKRVVNILRKQASEYDAAQLAVDTSAFVEDGEKALFDAYRAADEHLDALLEDRDWEAACQQLAALKDPVDHFFDNVMVMADDADLKRNRIALLYELESLFKRVADISVIS